MSAAVCETVGNSFSEKLYVTLSSIVDDNKKVVNKFNDQIQLSIRHRVNMFEEALKAEIKINLLSKIMDKLSSTDSVESALLHGFIFVQEKSSTPINRVSDKENEALTEISELLLTMAKEYTLRAGR